MSVGRSSDCDIVIDNAAVSAFHAVLSQSNGKLLVEDAASTNGVMADGAKRRAVELKPGDSVDIAGKYAMRLVSAPAGSATRISSSTRLADESHKETVLLDTTTLAKLSHGGRPAYLTLATEQRSTWIIRLEMPSISIGGARSSDIRLGGIFTPGNIATIDRREDGYYLCVADGREIEVDGRRVSEDLLLQEGNRFRIRELSEVFHERAGARH